MSTSTRVENSEIADEKYLSYSDLPIPSAAPVAPFKTDSKNIDYAYEKGAKRNFEPWWDQSKMEEVNETTEKRLHRLEVDEAQEEEMELRERNAMAQLEEKMMGNKRGMHIADTLDEIRIRNAQMEKGGRGRVEEKALAIVREAAVEQRSKADRENDEIARKAFVVVKPLYEQSP